MATIAKVGKKGEVVLKKPERDIAGIKPGDKVIIIGRPGEIIIRKIPSLEELLRKPPKIKLTIEELKKLREDVRKEIEERLLK
mgnify:CR=1 FL=1